MAFKLGKVPAVEDYRNLKMGYLFAKDSPLYFPPSHDVDEGYSKQTPIEMFGNDMYANCVIVGRANQTLRFERDEQHKFIPLTLEDVLNEYWVEAGGEGPEYDNGLVMLYSLRDWRKRGWKLSDGNIYSIHAFAQIDPQNKNEIKTAIFYLNGILVGLSLPKYSMEQLDRGDIWDIEWGRESEGGHCFSGDTKISLLDGTEHTFLDLVENYHDKKFWVYSCDEHGNIVPGLAHHPRKTGENRKLLKITLDNGEEIKCTPEHLFMLRNGEYKEAGHLQLEDSLMPLYRKKSIYYGDSDYEEVYVPSKNKWKWTHTMVLKHCPKGFVRHYIDFNRFNNNPENLELMLIDDHTKLHSRLLTRYNKSQKGRLKSRETMIRNWSDPEFRTRMVLVTSETGKKNIQVANSLPRTKKQRSNIYKAHLFPRTLKQLETSRRNGIRNITKWNNSEEGKENALKQIEYMNTLPITDRKIEARRINAAKARHIQFHVNRNINDSNCQFCTVNHKIVSIEEGGFEDVYDLTVDTYHNFALTAGIFVHNCVYVCGYNEIGPVCVTWGRKQQMSWNFFELYCDEAYGVVDSKDSWVVNHVFNSEVLEKYLRLIERM